MLKRWPLAALVVGAAFVGGLMALGVERGLTAIVSTPTPTLGPTATARSTQIPIVLVLPTEQPTIIATPLPRDVLGQQVTELRQQVDELKGLLLVGQAQDHLALAGASLAQNDLTKTNQELVAAHAALDRAFAQVGEALKQVVDNQRREVGRVRADLYIAPEGLDIRLRTMQNQLLALMTP